LLQLKPIEGTTEKFNKIKNFEEKIEGAAMESKVLLFNSKRI
jgi:hypothetical protein